MPLVDEYFASSLFGPAAMKKYLPQYAYEEMTAVMEQNLTLSADLAEEVARAMKNWAIDQGATHYTHWFQPMTGVTAEKHDAFIRPDGPAQVISDFKGKELIKSEPDASSFPSGGIRSTFEARGYTAWDPTSFAFVRDKTLYIPTLFVSYDGLALDKKTPLLRSLDALSRSTTSLLTLMGYDVQSISTSVGPEQEYFLVSEDMFNKRIDLQITGRTLFGAPAVKGQELDDHYFGSIPENVKAFMEEVDEELWKLGVYAKTEHKEVAPGQFELAPVFTAANQANDQNQLTMEVLQRCARHHGLVCLLHEKPFAGINGSGKHNNWSFSLNGNDNLLEPGDSPQDNLRFLLILAAIIKGVDEYQDLLRLSVATAGNDHRLGGHEAPPAIVSIYLGDELSAILKAIADQENYVPHSDTALELGVSVLPNLPKDTSDRNRTSPFAFTGNKFEFRMLGSSLNISCPNVMLNTIVAEELDQFTHELESWPAEQMTERIIGLIRKTLNEHNRICFSGDGYNPAWSREAEERGLANYRTTPEALIHYTDPKNLALFTRHNIYTPQELHARESILLENYEHLISIEARTMEYMLRKQIIPAMLKWQKSLIDLALAKNQMHLDTPSESAAVHEISTRLSRIEDLLRKMERLQAEMPTDPRQSAFFASEQLLPVMEELRENADALEKISPAEYWPLPDYSEILLLNH